MPPSTSLVPSGPLSHNLPAELRLAQAISEFALNLDDAGKQKFQQLQVQLSRTAPPSPADVIALTEDLNREGASRHASWRPAAGTRIGGFLRRIQQFAAFGDIFIGGSQNLIASGVWATVRAMLEATICHHVYFDQVSSLLMRLTTSWTITQEFVQNFPGSKELQTYLAEYLIRIVCLCRHILLYSKRSPAVLLAASLFSSFEAEFLPLQQELDQWGLLIEKKFASLTTKTVLDAQTDISKGNRRLSRLILSNSKHQALLKEQALLESQQRLLSSLSPNQEAFETIFRRERKRGNCSWLLANPDYKAWRSAKASLLFVTGHLGSGKTVGVANIAADLTRQTGGCAFFFCKQDDEHTLTRGNIIGSVVHQLIYNNLGSCHWNVLEDGCRLPVGSITVDTSLQLLPTLLPRDRGYFIVMDGLEDCPPLERFETIQTLLELHSNFNISLCVSNRTDSVAFRTIASSFADVHSVSLNDETRDPEMRNYIKTEVQRRNRLRSQPFEADVVSHIVKQLEIGAQGMYLWVSLQLETLFPTHTTTVVTPQTVLNILENLPGDLPEAFDQALARISDTRYGTRIFALVAAAVSPLTGDQLKVALTVEPGNATWEFGKLPQDAQQLVDCCGGSLIELDEEDGKVRYIHHSVLLHLSNSQPSHDSLGLSWLEAAEQAMGLVCTAYLSYGIFDTRITATEKIDANRVVQESQDAAKSASPVLAHFIKHIKNGKQRKQTPTQLNVLRVLHQIRFEREDDPLKCFLPYARKHWLHHTRFLHADETKKEYLQWQIILEEKSQIVATPWVWTSSSWSDLLIYAAESSHCCLFQYVLRSRLEFRDLTDFSTLVLSNRNDLKVKGPWLDDILARYIAGSEHPSTKVLTLLLELGASPNFSLDYNFYTYKGQLRLSEVARHLCNVESTLRGATLGLPLLRSFLAISAESWEETTGCVFPAIITGWDLAMAEFLRYPYFMRFVGIYRCPEYLGLAIETGQLVIARLLVESGTPVDVSHEQSAKNRGWRAIPQVMPPKFTMELLFVTESLKQSSVSTSRNVIYSELERNPNSATKFIRDTDEKGLFQYDENLISALLWITRNTCFQALVYLLDESDIGHVPDLGISGGADPLLLALETYRPGGERVREYRDHGSEVVDIISKLVCRAKQMNRLDYRDEHGYSALHYAATWNLEYNNYSPVGHLLIAGADSNVVSHENHTPLLIVLSSSLPIPSAGVVPFNMPKLVDTVNALLNHGADPNLKCANGPSPLHFAAARGDLEVVGLLLEAGALDIPVSELSEDLRNPLEMACLVSSVHGWGGDELAEWGKRAQEAKTVSDWYNIWRWRNETTIG